MATRNLFRFVSVRPPIPATVDDACRLINKEAGAQFVEEVMIRRRKHKESLEVARRAVSLAFIESAEHFARSRSSSMRLPASRSSLVTFLQELRRSISEQLAR